MSWWNPFTWIERAAEGVTDLLSWGADLTLDAVDSVSGAVFGVLDTISNTVEGILNDPLPAVLQVAGSAVGIPPYVTAAALTAARGGDIEDVAKSAAISYATSTFLTDTQIGQDILGNTVNQWSGDFTDALIENFDLPVDKAIQVAKVANASLTQGLVGGMNAAFTGKDVIEGIGSGFTSGLILSGTSSTFDELNKDPNWGLSPTALNVVKGIASTGINAIVSGNQDPAAAIGNYIAYATLKMGGSEVRQVAQRAFEDFNGKTETAKQAQDAFTSVKARYDQEVENFNRTRMELVTAKDTYDRVYNDQYKPIESQLNDYKLSFDTNKAIYDANKAEYEKNKYLYEYYGEYQYLTDATYYANQANAAAAAAKTAADRFSALENDPNTQYLVNQLTSQANIINSASGKLENIRQNIESPGQVVVGYRTVRINRWGGSRTYTYPEYGDNLATEYKNAADKYAKEYSSWSSSRDAAERATANYNKIVAEIAVRDATIDAMNSGAITIASTNPDGSFVLSNGMTMKDGRFFQDDGPIFTNAQGVSQNSIDLRDNQGNIVRFGSDLGRQLSSSDVKNILSRDYGINVSDDEARQFVGQSFTNYDNTKFQDFALNKISSEFQRLTDKPLSQEQAKSFMNQEDAVSAAQNAAFDTLDIPPEYVPEGTSTAKKVELAEAFKNARNTGGAGALFEWTDDTGQKRTLAADTKPEAEFKKTVETTRGDYEERDVNVVKNRLIDAVKRNDFDMNPADLTEKEMGKFIDNWTKATPEQRAQLLRGSDTETYKVINDMFQSYAGVPERMSGKTYEQPESVGSVKESDLTNYNQILKTGARGAAADIIGLGTRAGQVIGDVLGYDTPMLDKLQTLMTKDKETNMDKLVGNERAVAGGLASGIISGVSFATGGALGAVATMGGIAANNAWIEGTNAVIDNKGNAYRNEDEARKLGVFEYRKLTPEENGLRTAMMASAEMVGEALGAKALGAIMKGIPLSGSANEIIEGTRRLALGMLGEQATEQITTAMQMAADKWTSVGLGRNATFEDYKNAMMDTAIATAVAVGTTSSGASLSQSLRSASQTPNIFSVDTRESSVEPTLPSLAEVYKSYGINQSDFDNLVKGVENTIKEGGVGIQDIRDRTANTLSTLGVSTSRAEVLSNELIDRALGSALESRFEDAGVDPAQIASLIEPIKTDIKNQVGVEGLQTSLQGVAQTTGLDRGLDKLVDVIFEKPPTMLAPVQPETPTTPSTDTTTTDTTATDTTATGSIADTVANLPTQYTSGAATGAGTTTDTTTGTTTGTTTETPVQQAIDTGVSQLPPNLQSIFDNFSSLQKAEVENRIQQGENLQNAITNVASSVTNLAQSTGQALEQVSQAVVNLGTATQAAFNNMSESQKAEVAARVQQGQDLQAAINNVSQETTKQITDVRTALEQQIDALGTTTQQQYENLSAAQKAEVAARAQQGQDLQTAIAAVGTQTQEQIRDVQQNLEAQLAQQNTATQEAFSKLTQAQQQEVANRVQQGQDLQTAIAQSQQAVQQQITTLSEDFQSRLAASDAATKEAFSKLDENQKAETMERVRQGEDLKLAVSNVQKELGEDISGLKKQISDQAAAQRAAAAESARRASSDKLLSLGLGALGAKAAFISETPSEPDRPFVTSGAGQAKFESPLEQFMQTVEAGSYMQPQFGQTEESPMQPSYFAYGQPNEIDDVLNKEQSTTFADLPSQNLPFQDLPYQQYAAAGGLMAPLMARSGGYAGGGLNVVNHAGKNRIDYRQGDAVSGPGDGQSDDIPAMLADGEFVIPADVVSALGNGSTKAGSDKLYDMMHSIRAHHRSGKPQDLPPPAKKSPLDYLKGRR